MNKRLQCGRYTIELATSKIMGVLNCTPDSFSDGGKYQNLKNAVKRAEEMVMEGADIIDIGAESTRPNAQALSVEEEIARLSPIVKTLIKEINIPISIDTRNTKTMQAMLDLGVDMINDVRGFEDQDAFATVAPYTCALCIMHMRGTPQTMQQQTKYQNITQEVRDYLDQRVKKAQTHQIAKNRILLDIGFGFAKTPAQNMRLIAHLKSMQDLDLPLLIGVSRKSTIGHYLNDRPVDGRLIGSVVLAALACYEGAKIIRAHDIKETKDALNITEALIAQKNNPLKNRCISK